MINYNYNKITGEFVGESQAKIDPLESEVQKKFVYILPAYATQIAPPTVNLNEAAVFNGGAWEVKSDYRGSKVYDTTTGMQVKIIGIGELLEAHTLLVPAFDFLEWDSIDECWIEDVNQLKKKMNIKLKTQLKSLYMIMKEELDFLLEFGATGAELAALDAYKVSLRSAYAIIKTEVLLISDYQELIDYNWNAHIPTSPMDMNVG